MIDFFIKWDDTEDILDIERCLDLWPDIDRGGTFSKWIEKLDDALEICVPLISEMI